MKEKFVVTIGRQYCSGGMEIGKKLADELGVKFYDKELISLAAKESGFTESLFEKADEAPSNSFLYSVVMGSYPVNSMFFQNNDILTNDKLFATQSNVIKDIAKEESCVIIGRCSDYILREEKNLLRVFLRADMDFRKERYIRIYTDGKSKNPENIILKTDKRRASYYSYYTGNVWDNVNNYDLIINTGKVGINNSVKQIINYLELML